MSKDKVRVYQLARELDVESRDLVEMLQSMGADVKNHMTAMDADMRKLAEDLVAGRVKPSSAQAPAPPAAPAKAPLPTPKPPRPAEIPDPKRKKPQAMPSGSAPEVEEETSPEVAPAPIAEQQADVPSEIAAQDPTELTNDTGESEAEVKPIPKPTRGRIMSMDTPSAGAGGARTGPRPDRRPTRPERPIIAVPPMMKEPLKRDSEKSKPEVKAQKPVMRLPADQLRQGKFSPADLEDPSKDGGDEGDGPSRRGARGPHSQSAPGAGSHVGREERQRRRGQRAQERKIIEQSISGDDETGRRRRGLRPKIRKELKAAKPTGPIPIQLPTTVRSFCEATGIKAVDVCFKFMDITGERPTINSSLNEEEIGMLALAYEIEVDIRREKGFEEIFEESLLNQEDPEDLLVPRPPVVTFMGHVDHGKTSLMDRIRKANVVDSEAGGITQHVGAYQVHMGEHTVTFLDTPGHEAFTAMRARGANVTDVVVLVVAANDGVMPQTEEAINHAKAAEVPIVVAMNKADLPGANFDKVQQQLSQHGLIPDEWGGDTLMIKTSATTGDGMEELIEAIHTVAELRDLKANPARAALGSCIEATMDGEKGVKATMLVLNGTLRTGDVILCGPVYGRVRAMYDEHGRSISEAGPAAPVLLYGLDAVPEAGERFFVLEDLSKAREIAEERQTRERLEGQVVRQHVSLDKLFNEQSEREVQDLRLILKTDVRGSLEAIKAELSKLEHAEVRVRILHSAVGSVNESDVLLADTSDAIIIAFQVVPDARAEALAKEKGVEIRRYSIIYQVSDDIKQAMEGLLIPDKKEVQLGRAVVQETFSISRFGTIAGCRVIQGTVERSAHIRVIRDGTIVGTYPIETLKRHKDDAREVREGLECGIKIANFNDVKKGDVLEAFKIEEVKRTLDS